MRKTGEAKRKLSIENMVKMMFDCQGNTRTYYQIETVTTSAKVVDIDIKYVEEVLIKSGEYALDGKKGLLKKTRSSSDRYYSGTQRPKKNSESGKSAKKKRHTIKALVVVEMRSKQVCTTIKWQEARF